MFIIHIYLKIIYTCMCVCHDIGSQLQRCPQYLLNEKCLHWTSMYCYEFFPETNIGPSQEAIPKKKRWIFQPSIFRCDLLVAGSGLEMFCFILALYPSWLHGCAAAGQNHNMIYQLPTIIREFHWKLVCLKISTTRYCWMEKWLSTADSLKQWNLD